MIKKKVFGTDVDLDSRKSFLDFSKSKTLQIKLKEPGSMNSKQRDTIQKGILDPIDDQDEVVEVPKSDLSQEVQRVPLYHLRRLFKAKLTEYNSFKSQNRINEFNSNTIFRADTNDSYKKQLEKEHSERMVELERLEKVKLALIQRRDGAQSKGNEDVESQMEEPLKPEIKPTAKITINLKQPKLLLKEAGKEQNQFLDKSLYIARESARSFLQSYKQKYRIELSDVSPFNKEQLKSDLKKRVIEKLFQDQITLISRGKRPPGQMMHDTSFGVVVK